MKKTGAGIPSGEVFGSLRARPRRQGPGAEGAEGDVLVFADGRSTTSTASSPFTPPRPRRGRSNSSRSSSRPSRCSSGTRGWAGWRGERELRELIISVGETGYVARYQYDELEQLVRVLGARRQREAGYPGR